MRKEYASFYSKSLKQQLAVLESTPRSLKRLIETSETTPTSGLSIVKDPILISTPSGGSTRKRNFQEMNGDDETGGSDKKRLNYETKGRRLFSPAEPSTSGSSSVKIAYFEGSSRTLTTILEELDSPKSKNFQNLSPSPIKRQLNIIKSPESVRSNRFASPLLPKDRQAIIVNSPTTNLPNFVVDGDAPHLGLMSPHKKEKKENVDWLTKIRKQKLLTLNNTALDKSTSCGASQDESSERLKSIENKSDAHELKKNQKKNESILKFFSARVPDA